MRRLLNVIQLSHQQNLSCMMISLEGEKPSTELNGVFLFPTLNAFGLGDVFGSRVKPLHNRPRAAVRIHGRSSSYVPLGRRTRQGCPLSPLFAIIYKKAPREAVRNMSDISGISIDVIIKLPYVLMIYCSL